MQTAQNKILTDGVLKKEKGILSQKGIYFYETSPHLSEVYHHVLWGAEYKCNFLYKVNRSHLNCFILFLIENGSMTFEYRNKRFSAYKNEVVLLDCKYSNIYYVENFAAFKWFHFAGGLSQKLCDTLYDNYGSLFLPDRTRKAREKFNDIFALMTEKINLKNENALSNLIYELLSSLFYTHHTVSLYAKAVSAATSYISLHYADPINLDELSILCNMSLYHFCHVFKREIGVSPHKYIMNTRIIKAKEKLSKTNLSVEQVAFSCGFNSREHFIRAFFTTTKLTPGKFRQIQL